MHVKQCIAAVTATGVLLSTSNTAMAFDPFGHSAMDRTQAQIERNAAEITRNRALLEALKRERRHETTRFTRRQEESRARQMPPSESQAETEVASPSWENLALAAIVASGLLWLLGNSPGTNEDAGSNYGGIGGSNDDERRWRRSAAPSENASSGSDPSVGYFWGNPVDGTDVKSLWGTTKEE